MLTNEEIARYKKIQATGLPLSQDLVSLPEAVQIVGRTFAMVTKIKATNPGRKESGRITWWIMGSIIMLDRSSLMEIAIDRRWIEEVK